MICIIPARGGSTRIPKKNIKLFHGKPIISYSIKTARESKLFDRIIVSTDSDEIENIALARESLDLDRTYQEVEIHHRSEAMAENGVGTQEVVKSVLEDLGDDGSMVCCIYPTSPLMCVDDLKFGVEVFGYNDDDPDYSFSVGTNPLSDAGQFYWGYASCFLEGLPLFSAGTIMIPIADNRVCDINTPEDWARAEKMYEALHSS